MGSSRKWEPLMQGSCGGREYHLHEDSVKVRVAGMERAKMWAGPRGTLKGFVLILRAKITHREE